MLEIDYKHFIQFCSNFGKKGESVRASCKKLGFLGQFKMGVANCED